jgi:hypothetical protein
MPNEKQKKEKKEMKGGASWHTQHIIKHESQKNHINQPTNSLAN